MSDEIKNAANPEMQDDLGFSIVGNDAISSEKIIAPRYSYWRSVFRVFFRKKGNIFLIAMFVILIVSAVFVPMICKYDPTENVTNAQYYNKSPKFMMKEFGVCFKWLLGSGQSGNSITYNIFAGARRSLLLSIICAAINMTVGIIVGAVWGFSKRLDAILIPIFNIITVITAAMTDVTATTSDPS